MKIFYLFSHTELFKIIDSIILLLKFGVFLFYPFLIKLIILLVENPSKRYK